MLIDDITIEITAGHGGPGKVSFGRKMRSGPDGGNGGKGGDVYITTTSDLFALNQFSKNKHVKAQDGQAGGSNRKSGLGGSDTVLKLPIGSVLQPDDGEEIELTDINQRILIATGGLGGLGNFELRSARNTTPMNAQKGLPGTTKHIRILLKLLARFGLIGLPNAGKSSMLNELTRANARTGNYPFTTLETNLGDFHGSIIADIPGLIEGAAEGKGLGIKFLQHIEKVELLLHCIALDSATIETDYQIVNRELEKFSPQLLKKKRVLLLTKTDAVTPQQVETQKLQLKKYRHPMLPVSIYDTKGISKLEKKLLSHLHQQTSVGIV